MKAQLPAEGGRKPKITAAHVCPSCGFSIDLKDIGLRVGTTGLVTCPRCDWSGPLEIHVVDMEPTA